VGQANFPVLGPLKPQKHMIWCTYIGKTFCQVWTDHKLVNTTQKLQFGVMVTEQSNHILICINFCDFHQ
jgi:hypothetical protein